MYTYERMKSRAELIISQTAESFAGTAVRIYFAASRREVGESRPHLLPQRKLTFLIHLSEVTVSHGGRARNISRVRACVGHEIAGGGLLFRRGLKTQRREKKDVKRRPFRP